MADPIENFLQDQEEQASFSVLVRIADEFYTYLETQTGPDYPNYESADYVCGTIRSGFDFFFELHPYTYILNKRVKRDVAFIEIGDFINFRMNYTRLFQELLENSTGIDEAFATVMDLCRLHFVFVGIVV